MVFGRQRYNNIRMQFDIGEDATFCLCILDIVKAYPLDNFGYGFPQSELAQ